MPTIFVIPDLDAYPKVKAEFEKWYVRQSYYTPFSFRNFCHMPVEMQQGIYSAFFRSNNLFICIDKRSRRSFDFKLMEPDGWVDFDNIYRDYNTGIIAAIEAAMSLLEKKLIA